MDVEIRCLLQQDEPSVELVVHKGTVRDFVYGIKSVKREITDQLIREDSLPHFKICGNVHTVDVFLGWARWIRCAIYDAQRIDCRYAQTV